jgi:hypothetical protein
MDARLPLVSTKVVPITKLSPNAALLIYFSILWDAGGALDLASGPLWNDL